MKKLIAIFLTLVMVLGLAACGKADTDTNNADNLADDRLYVPVVVDNMETAAAVKAGAEAAGKKLDVNVVVSGPATADEAGNQSGMIKTEAAKAAAMVVNAVSEDDLKGVSVPVIGYGATAGSDAVAAKVYVDDAAATAVAAQKLANNTFLLAALRAATPEDPVILSCLATDVSDAQQKARVDGFVNKMAELTEAVQPGLVSIEGHEDWAHKIDNAAIIIHVEVSKTTELLDVQSAAMNLFAMEDLGAVLCINETALLCVLSATNDGGELAGGKYDDVVCIGIGKTTNVVNAVRQGYFYGGITENTYQIGYAAVELALKAANGEEVADVDAGVVWYDKSNIERENIAIVLQ